MSYPVLLSSLRPFYLLVPLIMIVSSELQINVSCVLSLVSQLDSFICRVNIIGAFVWIVLKMFDCL